MGHRDRPDRRRSRLAAGLLQLEVEGVLEVTEPEQQQEESDRKEQSRTDPQQRVHFAPELK
jgi:hypothetical protein